MANSIESIFRAMPFFGISSDDRSATWQYVHCTPSPTVKLARMNVTTCCVVQSFGSTCRLCGAAGAWAWGAALGRATTVTSVKVKIANEPRSSRTRMWTSPQRRNSHMVIEDGPGRTGSGRRARSLAPRGGKLRRLGDYPHELTALQQLPALAAASRRAVLRRRDRLLGT